MSVVYSKHGMTNTKLYNVFKGVKSRTRYGTKRSSSYVDNGIVICDEWLNDSSLFIAWALSNGYKDGLQIDRIDNSKGYSPDNCRWVTPKENCQNRSTTRMITVLGEVNTISYFSEKYGVNHHTISTRLSRGWSESDAATKKSQKGVRR